MKKHYLLALFLFSGIIASAQMPGYGSYQSYPSFSPMTPLHLPVLYDRDTVSYDTYLTYRSPNIVSNNGQILRQDTLNPPTYFIEFASSQYVSGTRRVFRPSFNVELLDQQGSVVFRQSFYRHELQMVYDRQNPGYTFYSVSIAKIPMVAFNYAYAIRISEY